MAHAREDLAEASIDPVIERIRRVYRGWNRGTSVAQMRSDWARSHKGGRKTKR